MWLKKSRELLTNRRSLFKSKNLILIDPEETRLTRETAINFLEEDILFAVIEELSAAV